jgi:energy-coupling factor transporter ATP-binding protein EcfA2
LDEPLTSLDPSLREEVQRAILAVHEEYGPALVLVTHDLQEAGRMADRRVTAEGKLTLAGWMLEGFEPDPGERQVALVFGVDGGRAVPRGSGGVSAQVVRVRHHPEGATARVTIEWSGKGGPSVTSGALSCEVSADPHCPPDPGVTVEVLFHPQRMHVFDEPGTERGG